MKDRTLIAHQQLPLDQHALHHPAIDAGQAQLLHRHFRKFNVVYGPEGKPLFFRYYDPRVIVDVLKVLDEQQLKAFFGPVDRMLLTQADGVPVGYPGAQKSRERVFS